MSATAFQRMRREAAKKVANEKIVDHQMGSDDGEKQLKDMTTEELTIYAEKNNIDIGKATSQAGILGKIEAAEKVE